MRNPFDHCDECPWPGKCEADETCWLEVELDIKPPPEDEDPEPDLPEAA